MTALLTNAGVGATANTTISATTQVIISGDFSGGHAVKLELASDSLNDSIVGEYNEDTQLSIAAKATTTITATIVKQENTASGTAVIDVSVI